MPMELLQELFCHSGYIGMDIMEKDHFLRAQTRVFCPDSFLHMLQCCAVVVHIHWYHMVQNFENAPCDSGCHQQCL